ncbi:MAG: DUF4397 domain-containing protein [Bdellovibrionota bacterium]
MFELPEFEYDAFLRCLTICFVALTSLASCSGGGGGGGGGGGNDGTHRSTGTGIRIIHGALDAPPVDLKIGEEYLNRGAFLLPNFYAGVGSGTQNVLLERANSPGVNFFSEPVALAKDTEYTLLLTGRTGANTFNVNVIEEPVVRPESGQGRVQLMNALEGSSPLILSGGGITLGPVPFRNASGYAILPAGDQVFTVTNTRGGVVGTFPVNIADRGESTIVFGGATSEGVILHQVYTDLD